ncbi:hypothetical protein B5J93_00780 [Moraxella equi]|uniref:Uncharacterized protein n=1 Tax=Moraxella equi TaxID=60442 RepID=A0ABX3NKT2_9GAMM|nr:hypothetical protein B5J93_00780 [Moraxella equi]
MSFDWAKNDKIPTDKLLNAISELEQGDVLTYDSLDDFVKAYDTTPQIITCHEKNHHHTPV